jgi:hypothetical protein
MYTIVVELSSSLVGASLHNYVCSLILMFYILAVIITDAEYPVRPAFSLLTKVIDDFIAKVPVEQYSTPATISFPEVTTYVQKYQDPRQADSIMKVQQELDETKIVLVFVIILAYCNYNLIFHSTRPLSPFLLGERS